MQTKAKSRMGTSVAAIGLIFSLAASIVLATAADAQESGEPDVGDPSADRAITLTSDQMPHVGSSAGGTDFNGMVLWPEGRRAYQFDGSVLVALDLDTFEELGRTPLPDLIRNTGTPLSVVDPVRGRLFVPFAGDCLGTTVGHPCFGGLHVVDGTSLAIVRTIDFLSIGDDGTLVNPGIWALSFSELGGEGGVVHLLLTEGTLAPPAVSGDPVAPSRIRNSVFLLEWEPDADEHPHRWMHQVTSCTNMPPGAHAYALGNSVGLDRPFAVFRSQVRDAIYVGCYGSGSASQVVRLNLDTQASESATGVATEERFPGPSAVLRMMADPVGERLHVESSLGRETQWWVFDGRRDAFIGAIGVGPYDNAFANKYQSAAGLDPESGRLYALGPPLPASKSSAGTEGGFFASDARRSIPVVPQAVHFPEVTGITMRDTSTKSASERIAMVVDPATQARPRRIFYRHYDAPVWRIIEDRLPVSLDPTVLDDVGARSADVREVAGSTDATFTGEARGFGFRTILVGGIEAAINPSSGGATDLGVTRDAAENTYNSEKNPVSDLNVGGQKPLQPVWDALPRPANADCLRTTREFVLGLTGSRGDELAEISDRGTARARAYPAWADLQTRKDLEAPTARCGAGIASWDDLTRELGIRIGEPDDARWRFDAEATCQLDGHGDAPESDRVGDDLFTGVAAEADCATERIAASSRAGLAEVGPVRVGQALSEFHVVRGELNQGTRSIIESAVRGVSIHGADGQPLVRIDEIGARAETWANGRHQAAVEETDVNCDPERTAGTCYTTWFKNVRIAATAGAPAFECNDCPDVEQLAAALDRALGAQFLVRLPALDEQLARGLDDGSQAAIQKRRTEAFAAENLNMDAMGSVPAALELVRAADSAAEDGRGRTIYQFAGVQASSTYAIQCLLTVVGQDCTMPPASLTVRVTDGDGEPLLGAVLEVRDASGSDPLAQLPKDRICASGADGECRFDALAPGSYVVHQRLAPPPYLPADDVPVTLGPGDQVTVEIVNVRDAAGIAIRLLDAGPDSQPLEHGEFEVHVDGGGTVPAGATPIATCRTDATGACMFDASRLAPSLELTTSERVDAPVLVVPVGPYVVRQKSAPKGYAPAADVPFAFTDPGQLAEVVIRNARQGQTGGGEVEPVPPPVSTPVEDIAPEATVAPPIDDGVVMHPPLAAPSTVSIESFPAPEMFEPLVAPPAQPSVVNRLIALPGAAARLLARQPKEAAAYGGMLLLFGGSAASAWRRRLLAFVLEV